MRIGRKGDGVCVVSDNEVFVMCVTPDGKDTAINMSHTVRKYLFKEELN
jgi:hypothetical protein